MRDITARGSKRQPTPRIHRAYIPGRLDGWGLQYYLAGKVHRRFFSAKRYGSVEAARLAAASAANEWLKEHQEFIALHMRLLRRKSNATGLPGLFFKPSKNGRSAFWLAFWLDEEGRRRQHKFAESVYGPEEARARAVALRTAAARRDLARLQELAEILGAEIDLERYVDPDVFESAAAPSPDED